VTVYCKKCKLVYAESAYRDYRNCVRCDGGKLITEIIDWLMVIDSAS
jgi:RNA polymerase subunit RPABC4/transcription elongation factor Spt4